MSEPNLVDDAFAMAQEEISDQRSAAVDAAVSDAGEQLGLCLDFQSPQATENQGLEVLGTVAALTPQAAAELHNQRQLWEQEHAALVHELMQARSLMQEQVERIRHLEQALDQSLASLKEVRLQVVDQQFLETQLAATEEISNIQQQAIMRLKQQLAEQQQALETQMREAEKRDTNLREVLTTMEALAQNQQVELEHLRSQQTQDQVDVRSYQTSLEKQLGDFQAAFDTQQQRILNLEAQLVSAHTQASNLETRLEQTQVRVQELSQNLKDRQANIDRLERDLQQSHTLLQEQQCLVKDLPSTPRAAPAKSTAPDSAELAIAETKVEELETEVARQMTTQAMLQRACQELEEARDSQRTRIVDLEKQTADMQEQILRQAQQASEYETAVQHWKDRYFTTQTQVAKLKELLDQALPNPPADLVEVLAALEAATAVPPEPASPALLTSPQLNRETKVDLPEFLLRRRNYKARRS